MTDDRSELTIEYDHHSAQSAHDPWALLATMRGKCPVAWTESHDGYWVVSKHKDVTAALRNWQAFSSLHDDAAGFGGQAIPPNPFKTSFVETDPPYSLKFRELLTPEFSANRVATSRPVVSRTAAECIEAVVEKGHIDLVNDFVNQVPAKATLEIIGMDPEDWFRYALPMHEICHASPGTPQFQHAVDGLTASFDHVGEAVDARRAQPRDDIVSRVVNATVDGGPIERDVAVELIWTLIMGGLETVTGVMAYTLQYLSRNPEDKQRLIREPALIPTACDEFMRYFTPSRNLGRTVTEDVEFAGVRMRRGDRVLLSLAGSNHDEEVFDDPEKIVLDRTPNKHLVFGHGVHRCLGDRLAKAELEVIVEEVLDRIPDFTVIEAETFEYTSMPQTTGFVTMPAEFTPRIPRPVES